MRVRHPASHAGLHSWGFLGLTSNHLGPWGFEPSVAFGKAGRIAPAGSLLGRSLLHVESPEPSLRPGAGQGRGGAPRRQWAGSGERACARGRGVGRWETAFGVLGLAGGTLGGFASAGSCLAATGSEGTGDHEISVAAQNPLPVWPALGLLCPRGQGPEAWGQLLPSRQRGPG